MAHPTPYAATIHDSLGLVALQRAARGIHAFSRGHDESAGDYFCANPVKPFVAAVFTPWIAAGIVLLIGFFASYLTALSWADLTFVFPATAFGNVIVAFLARFWLHKPISSQRWVGIGLITLGVGFVAHGPSLTERPAPCECEDPAAAGAMTIPLPAAPLSPWATTR